MRAAPSTMSSGGWKPCSAVLRRGDVGRILVGDPARVDAVHVDAVARRSRPPRCGSSCSARPWPCWCAGAGGLEPPVELALHRRDVDDVLVAVRACAACSGLSRAFSTNGATALTSCTSSSSTDDTSASVQAPAVPAAQVDLLQIRVEAPVGEQLASACGPSSASSRTCESSAERAMPGASIGAGRAWTRSVATHAARSRRAARRAGRASPSDAVSSSAVLVEPGRPAHGLAGVVDHEVEAVARVGQVRRRTPRRSACGADRGRRSRAGRPQSSKSGSRA